MNRRLQLLTTRTASTRVQTIPAANRDNRGRALTISTTISGTPVLTETLAWRNDSRLATYNATRGAGALVPSETRPYSYDFRGRLLTEPYKTTTTSTATLTASYQFDGNTESGAGVRTLAQVPALSTAYKTDTLTSFLTPVQETSTNSGTTTIGWAYDSLGSVTTRTLSTGVVQTLTWDSFGRLTKVSGTDGLDWKATYDGLGRRVQTLQHTATADLTITCNYDPQVEFLELGVAINSAKTWKLYGPGASGTYGSMQGLGGLETLIDEATGTTTGVLNDFFGNAVATVTGTNTVNWSPSAIGGYGILPGSNTNALDATHTLAQSILWRGHYIDPTGYYYMGARYYEPASGRFLSPDPLGHAASMSLYDFANGDPVNSFDPDGRFGKSIQTSFRSYVQNEYGYTITDRSEQRLTGSMLNAVTFGLANSIATSFGTTDIYGDYVDPITRKESRADLTLQAVMSVIPTSRVSSGASELAVRSASSLARLETRMASAEVSATVAKDVVSALKVTARPAPAYWERPPQYYIAEGVRRSVAARESNIPFIRARLVRPGSPDELIQVHLDQLHSPKASLSLADPRFSKILRPNYPLIEIQPKGLPGQSSTTPLLDVDLH